LFTVGLCHPLPGGPLLHLPKIAAMHSSPEDILIQHAGVGIVGTGNVAQALGALLRRAGVRIRAIAGRDPRKTAQASVFTGAEQVCRIAEIGGHAGIVLVAVSDDAIAAVAAELAGSSTLPKVALHTCGSQGPEVLAPLTAAGCATGVLHPLQTIPSPERGVASIPGCSCAYCGDTVAADCARQLILAMGAKPLALAADQWALYHAAAVLSINFHVALLDASLELWEQAGIPREQGLEAFAPIVRAGVENVLAHGPEQALTGPIRRGDATTVCRHLEAIAGAPEEIRALYHAGARRTLHLACRAGLNEDAASRVRIAIDAATRSQKDPSA
jgi:predicted short-subunit dehydrogenase-like oxidoreductase (DUF2520 family)